MATTKYLDSSGLTYLWGKIKAWAKRTLVSTITYDGEGKAIKMTKYDGTNDAEHTTTVVSAATIVADGGGVTTDTKNTAGSTADANKLYLVGAKTQSDYAQTYSQANAYITGGVVYSGGKETVNLSDSQALTNKTYNGYSLGAACAKAVDSSISSGSTSTNVPTSQAVEARIAAAIQAAQVGAAMFKGVVNAGTEISSLTAYSKGWYWVVGTAGTYVGQTCEAGDTIFCIADYSSAYSASDFNIIRMASDC